MLNAAKPGHSADPVSAVTKKGKTLLGVEHPIHQVADETLLYIFNYCILNKITGLKSQNLKSYLDSYVV